MNCVVCDELAGFNRAVIDRFSGRRVGGLCMNCEKSALGDSFRYTVGTDSEQCLFCERDGQFAFPRYLPNVEPLGDDVIVRSSLERVADAPALCDEHVHGLAVSVRPPNRAIK